MDMVEFLKDVKGDNFIFEKGKRYASIDDSQEENLKDKILVRQPNSPKKTNWWAEFSKDHENVLFKTLDNGEISLVEMIEENKILQN